MPNIKVTFISLYGIENTGIRSISAMLRSANFEPNIIFLKKWVNNRNLPPTKREIDLSIDLIAELKSDIIGMSFGTSYFKIATSITKVIKERLELPVVWGGIHATVVPEKCIEIADMVCVGEGEYPMFELAECLSKNSEIWGIKNLWIKRNNVMIKNEARPLIRDLDRLPFLDYEHANKFYIENDRLLRGDPIHVSAELRYLASRGCIFDCNYCYNSVLRKIYEGLGAYSRHKSVGTVIAELQYIISKMKRLKRIKFDDDTFVFSRDWIMEFCKNYRKKINLPFEILLNAKVANEKSLSMLKEAGLEKVQVGIQTGSERQAIENYNRPASNREILNFARMNRRLKLDVVYDIIFDDPSATEEDKYQLVQFLLSLPRPFSIYLYSLNLFPKTTLTQRLLKEGIISADEVEGENDKALRQFRLNINAFRDRADVFFLSLIIFTSKNFMPRWLIGFLSRRYFLKRHPILLSLIAQLSDLIKLSNIFIKMMMRGEMTIYKLQEYGNLKSLISQ